MRDHRQWTIDNGTGRKPGLNILVAPSLFLVSCCLFLVSSAFAQELNSANFKVLDPVMFSGGFSTSSGFQLTSSITQVSIGTSTSAGFGVNAGFLYYPFVTLPTPSATPGDGQVSLSWSASVGYVGWTVSGYSIGRSTVSGGPYTYTSVGSTLSSVQSGLSNGTTYYFVILPEDTFGTRIATSSQVSATPVASSGGYGGGSSYPPPVPDGTLSVLGLAYPNGTIGILRDSQLISTISTRSSGDFQGALTLPPAKYSMSFSGRDEDGNYSALFTLPITISSSATTTLEHVFLSPTLSSKSDVVSRGEEIIFSGFSYPESTVTLFLAPFDDVLQETNIAQTQVLDTGKYSHTFLVSPEMPEGKYVLRSRSTKGDLTSPFSEPFFFTIIEGEHPPKPKVCRPGDLNDDNQIELVDFSIASYWYRKVLIMPFLEKEQRCLNNDGRIDIIDFSLMAYYWTG